MRGWCNPVERVLFNMLNSMKMYTFPGVFSQNDVTPRNSAPDVLSREHLGGELGRDRDISWLRDGFAACEQTARSALARQPAGRPCGHSLVSFSAKRFSAKIFQGLVSGTGLRFRAFHPRRRRGG